MIFLPVSLPSPSVTSMDASDTDQQPQRVAEQDDPPAETETVDGVQSIEQKQDSVASKNIGTQFPVLPEDIDGETTVIQIRSETPLCLKCPKKMKPFFREHTLLRRKPAQMTCPNCLCAIETIVERHNTSTTHISALIMLPVCLCFLPYCSKVLRDSVHRCPLCGIHLGSHFASAHEALVHCLADREQIPDLTDQGSETASL